MGERWNRGVLGSRAASSSSLGRSTIKHVILEALQSLRDELRGRQVHADLSSRVSLAVSSCDHWPGGNSFWVTHLDGAWYVGTYLPVVYAVPESVSIADLCCNLLSRNTPRASYRLPDEFVAQQGLRELSDDEQGDLEARQQVLAKAYPPLLTFTALVEDVRSLDGCSVHVAERFVRIERDPARFLWLALDGNAWHVRLPSGLVYEALGEGDRLSGLCVYWLEEEPLPDRFDDAYLQGYCLQEVADEERAEIDARVGWARGLE